MFKSQMKMIVQQCCTEAKIHMKVHLQLHRTLNERGLWGFSYVFFVLFSEMAVQGFSEVIGENVWFRFECNKQENFKNKRQNSYLIKYTCTVISQKTNWV